MYRMANYGKVFSDELNNWLIDEAGLKQSKLQMSVYYKYSPDGSKLVVLSHVDDCVYSYISDELGKWFVGTIGKRLYVKFL